MTSQSRLLSSSGIQHSYESPIGRSPRELDVENAVETQSDLFVLSSAPEDCHQGTHIHLGGNMVVHHPVGIKIPHCIECMRMA